MRSRGTWVLAVTLCACSFQRSGLDPSDDAAPLPDVPVAPAIDAAPVDAGGCTDPAGLCAWARRRHITIDNVSSSESLVDFPMLLVLDGGRIDYGLARADGHDLRFVDDDGVTILSYEMDTWDPAGVSLVWVKIPHIPAGSGTDGFWMYYGNPTAGDGQAPNAVWTSGYRLVWHFRNPIYFIDSTGNGYTGSNAGAYPYAGPVGGGMAFNGAFSTYVDTGFTESLGQFTVEMFVQSASFSGGPNGPLMYDNNFQVTWASPLSSEWGTIGIRQGGLVHLASFMPLDGSTWYWLSGTYDGNALRAYRDGVLAAENPAPSGSPDAQSVPGITAKVGRHAFSAAPANYFNGAIDELRISNVARSASWIRAQDRSMRDQVLSFGPEE